MAAPLLQAQVDINAPASKVWALISDFRRMPQWSPQCRWMRPLGPLRQGTRTLNFNRRNRLFWPTTSTVVEVVPEKKLAFRVNSNRSIWTYELEPNGKITLIREQGEGTPEDRGAPSSHDELAHYYRFREWHTGREYVWDSMKLKWVYWTTFETMENASFAAVAPKGINSFAVMTLKMRKIVNNWQMRLV